MRLAAGTALVLVLAGCADSATVGQDPSPTPSYAADEVVLRVSYEGGLLPPGGTANVPYWSLLGDGRVFTLGPVPDIYPGPAFPNVRVATVSQRTVARIVEAARDAGVDGTPRDYGDPPVADASTTVFRLTTETGTVETEVYALAETDFPNEARHRLRVFYTHLTDLDAWLGEGTIGDDETYDPEEVAIYARSYRPADTSGITEQVVAWRGPDPAAGEGTGAGTCTVVTGDVLGTVIGDLRRSNTLTRWQAGGKDWSFTIRPLLPDEHTCEDGVR